MIVALAGGIGCGKSIVRDVLRAFGFDVYDTDSEARMLMDNSDVIKRQLKESITADAVGCDGKINRRAVAAVVFSDADKLSTLNSIVHSEVRNHFMEWAACRSGQHVFIETALLYESGLDKAVDEVWDVTAPLELRIRRVMARNNICREDVIARIESQSNSTGVHRHSRTYTIVNDDVTPVIPQIKRLLSGLC